MEIGKLPNEVLQKIVLDNIKFKREEVLIHAGIGEDCAVLDFGEKGCIVSSDPITGATKNIGKLAVNISCNDIAASGGEPIGIVITMLIPPTATIKDIEEVMRDAGNEASRLNVEIIGGHTEVTDVVNKMVLVTTVIGSQEKSKIMGLGENIEPGDKVIMTKYVGIEGTSIMAHDLEDRLKGSISEELIEEAKSLTKFISVVKDGKIATDNGAKYMHDITEGGLLGAAWEAAIANNAGIVLYEDSIPILQSTKDISQYLGINYLKLISSGSMLIFASEEKSDDIIKGLEKENIKGTIIGEITEKKSIILKSREGDIDIKPPRSDEIYKVI
ncbi:MAG: AIR synthase family protein [Andreesenia angusta]|nr:AIR synthase family protein [Andreesenia angusta]